MTCVHDISHIQVVEMRFLPFKFFEVRRLCLKIVLSSYGFQKT